MHIKLLAECLTHSRCLIDGHCIVTEVTIIMLVNQRKDQKGNCASRRDGRIREMHHDYNNNLIGIKRIDRPKSINVQNGGRLHSLEVLKKDTSKEMVSKMDLKNGWDSKEWMDTTVGGGRI